jgi:hypothetical protein
MKWIKKLFNRECKMGLRGPDSLDLRDRTKIPMESSEYRPINLASRLTPVRNQRNTNACGGYAGSSGLEIVVEKMKEKAGVDHWDIELSALELYYHARIDKKVDSGVFMRDLMKAMHKAGTVERRYWTDIDSPLHRPADLDYVSRFAIRGSYERIPITGDRRTVEDCIKVLSVEKLPIWIGMPMYDIQTRRAGHGHIYTIPGPSERNTGGHAMVIVGWKYEGNKRVFIVQNSWGTGWGKGGFFYLDEAVIAGGFKYVFDLWTLGREYF